MSAGGATGTGARAAALAAVLALALGLRLFMADRLFVTSFDTATVGLMGLHILEGERPLFYYGQDYMGSLEAYAAALAFRVFGVSTLSLSLAAISFALAWIAATYLLFHELYGHRGGLAAALTAAVPGWQTLWHSLATNGGYPGTFFFGTLSLWLALRLGRPAIAPGERRLFAAALGVTVALGVWTNFLVAAYVLAGGGFLLAAAARRRDLRLGSALAAAAAVGALGLLPWFLARAEWGAAGGKATVFSVAGIGRAGTILLKLLPQLVAWPTTPAQPLPTAVALAAAAAAAVLLIRSLAAPAARSERLRRLLPLLVTPVFLALYLPHSLAQLPAPRYCIPALALLLGSVFGAAAAAPGRRGRLLGWLALAVWTGFNGASALAFIGEKTPRRAAERAERERTVAAARRTGAGHVEILGSAIEGYAGQVYSFYARERPRFVSSVEERWPPAALGADRDATTAFMFKELFLPRVARSLTAAGAAFRTSASPPWAFAAGIAPQQARRRAIAPAALTVHPWGTAPVTPAEAADLADATAGTGIARAGDGTAATVVVRLHRPALIDGVCLLSGDGLRLPGSYRVEISADGELFADAGVDYRDLLRASTQGNRVYLGGAYAAQDLRFAPARASALRLSFAGGRPWRIDELRVMEHLGPGAPVGMAEVESIARALRGAGIDFTAADRWLSAQLAGRLAPKGTLPPVYPRFNLRDPRSLISRRLALRPGLAFVVDQAFADESEALLRDAVGDALSLAREDFPHYALLALAGKPGHAAAPPPALLWNGHLVLRDGPSGRRR